MKLNKYVYLGNCRISDDEKCSAGWIISMHFIAYTKDYIPLSPAYNTAERDCTVDKKEKCSWYPLVNIILGF